MTTTMEPPVFTYTPETADAAQIVKQKTVLIAVTLRKLGVKRKVDSQTQHITTETDRGVLAIQKVLLVAPELDKIKKLDGRIRTELRRMTLPDETLRRGWYLISKDMVQKIDTILEDYKAEREGYVGEFKANYWTRIKEAEPRLKGMFDYQDYPSIEELDMAFGMDIDYRDTIPHLDSIRDVADGIIHERQKQKAARDCEKIVKDVEAGLVEMLQNFTGHLAARLGRQPDGKLMVFKETSIAHFKEFVDNLRAMNVTGSVTIDELGAKARQLLEGVDVESLRKNEGFRDVLKEKLEGLKKEIDANVKPTGRKFARSLRSVEDAD